MPVFADWNVGQEAFKRGDYVSAHAAWLPLAERGEARAQAAIGSLYLNGDGVSIDYKEALKWTISAAEQGNVTGEFNMGTIYANGLGVDQDYVKAAEWFELAAEKDDAPSRFNLGVLYARGLGVSRDDVYALFMLNTAIIIAGDPEAELIEVGIAAEKFSYLVMMTMTEAEVQDAIKRTRVWEADFLNRYLRQRSSGQITP